MLERRAAQPVSAQMLHACGECEGRGVDGGRGGVPPQKTAARLLLRVRQPHFWLGRGDCYTPHKQTSSSLSTEPPIQNCGSANSHKLTPREKGQI